VKKILVLFLLIAGIYIGFMNMHKISWTPFGTDSNQANVSRHTDMIMMDLSGVKATILPENRNNVEADIKGKGKVIVKKSGNSISIQYKRKWFDWFGASNLNIYIPEDYDHNIKINMSAGNIYYNGMNTTLDSMLLDVSAGNIHLNNLKVNHFEQKGSAGNAVITSLTTKTGTFDHSAGNINLQHYSGKLKVSLSAGTFKVQMDKLTNDLKANVSTGSIMLDLPRSANFTLHGNASMGSISNEFLLKNKSKSRNHLEGTYGSGKHNITLGVSTGSIKIY
jgi:lia operon protein LiaG